MKLLGYTISLTKAAVPTADAGLQSLSSRGTWWPIIREAWAGAWQRNVLVSTQDALTFPTLWACLTLIAGDISKLAINLIERQDGNIWTVTENSAYSPLLRKPNRYHNRIKFVEYWILSKLIWGNAYALKQRDRRGVVEALYLLDPSRVKVLVAPDGSVFYSLSVDQLSGIDQEVVVPAREMIHDINVPLYHPLVGVSAIAACGLAAMQGLKIQATSEKFFANNAQPGGILTAPGTISDVTAKRLEDHWAANFSGDNAGKIAALGDGLKYEPLAVNAHDSQLIEQLNWTGLTCCSALHVPPWKVGIGPLPAYGNVQAANIEYYSQALQGLIENFELCLDEGLELSSDLGIQMDLSALLRMDSATQMDIAAKGVGAAIYKPNEARAIFDLAPVTGGDTPYLQQQNFSLAALDARDRLAPAPASITTAPPTREPVKEFRVLDFQAGLLKRMSVLAVKHAEPDLKVVNG